MASVITGKTGIIKMGGTPATVAQTTKWSFARSTETKDVQFHGDTDETSFGTVTSTTISVEGAYDPTETEHAALDADTANGSDFVLELYPGTQTTGDTYFTTTGNGTTGGTAVLTDFEITNDAADLVTFSATFKGALVKATVV